MWKRNFPIFKVLRGHHHHYQDIVVAAAILHNVALIWNNDNLVGPGDGEEHQEDYFVVEDAEVNAAERIRRGKHLRDQLRRRISVASRPKILQNNTKPAK
jgi:hypothetical protein